MGSVWDVARVTGVGPAELGRRSYEAKPISFRKSFVQGFVLSLL
jgi:hypothetical protein